MSTLASGTPGSTGLLADGAIVLVRVRASREVTTQAMIDTGSTISSIDRSLLSAIGAQQISEMSIRTVMGRTTAPVYAADILVSGVKVNVGLPGVVGDDLPPPVQCLIGRDILERYQLIYDGPGGVWALTDTGGIPVVQKPVPWTGYVVAGLIGAGLALGIDFAFALGEKVEAKRIFRGF